MISAYHHQHGSASLKIENIRTAAVEVKYAGSHRNTHHAWKSKTYLLVEVRTDEGVAGVGEVYCDGGASPRVMAAIIEDEVAPAVIGCDPRAITAIHEKVTSRGLLSGRAAAYSIALAGVDIALWDILGKVAGLPVRQLLGGFAAKVSVYGSGGMYGDTTTPSSLAAEMAAAVECGHAGVKIKAAGAPLKEDVARAAAVREAIGGARLMIDAMFAPDLPDAFRLARALEPFDLHFLEAPTTTRDMRGWAAIQRATSVSLAGPELEASPELIRDFLVTDAVRFVQFDACLAGGLTTGRNLAALAALHARPISLHCAASAVGLAASAHLGAAVPNCDSLECHLLHRGLREALWASGWNLSSGFLEIPDAPGLGLGCGFDDLIRMGAGT
jgi:L-alanine-DL-glutamate epimerase-like enolase superfamily enzyme